MSPIPVRPSYSREAPMNPSVHERYAAELLSSIDSDRTGTDNVDFATDWGQSRNAARAIKALICARLSKGSGHDVTLRANTTYSWKDGVFHSRNIADRDYLWTNLRRSVADAMHSTATELPVAYLLAFSDPAGTTLTTWALPEPILYDSLPSLPLKQGEQDYNIQIFPMKQRIDRSAESPDLSPFFREYLLSPQELQILAEARETDAFVKRQRTSQRKEAESSDGESKSATRDVQEARALVSLSHQLVEGGAFDPSSVTDGRDRVLSSIVRRRGQPTFRRRLIAAYRGRCAITGCAVEEILEAAHIVPYKGPDTHHLGNGLLLRTDLHTLFDLKLIALDVDTMRLLVSPSLSDSGYERYRGSRITLPDDPAKRPSSEALKQHRKASGL
jgi:predicted restriction endonuclease